MRRPVLAMLFLFLVFAQNVDSSPSKRLLIFAGAASKPPTEEATKIFQEKYSISVDVVFGGSGFVLFPDEIVREGRSLFPGIFRFHGDRKEGWFCCYLKRKSLVSVVTSINVQKGRSKGNPFSQGFDKGRTPHCYRQSRNGMRGELCGGNHRKESDPFEKDNLRKNIVNYTNC